MFPYVDQLNFIIALGAVTGLVILFVAILASLVQRKRFPSLVLGKEGKRRVYLLYLAYFLALVGTVMSLVYSEVFGFVPCGLCWIQRVFLYPQIIILGIAAYKRDFSVADTVIVLSALGALFAVDQYLLQMNAPVATVCFASSVESCADPVISEFGFVTFPLVSLTLFLWQIALMVGMKMRATMPAISR
ncbi:MAG: disulfide bond formation protein B [Candidatus Yonathbacteria bacterium]|nr:disulfide bond formation protein B [Candidatus Yonathbacteria bacterium]